MPSRSDPDGVPRCARAPAAAATSRSPRGAPTAAPAGTPWPRNSAGRVYCGKSSSPSRANVSPATDASSPTTPGMQPRHRVHDHQRRQLAARQHVIADRNRLGRQMLPDALVDPFVPPAQRPRGDPARSTASPPRASGARRRATSGSPLRRSDPPSAARWSRIRSTAANSGSGFSTIPGPPPNGMSSTTRCRSVVKSRRSCTRTSSSPCAMARATIAFRERRLHHPRKDRDDVDLHVGGLRPRTPLHARSRPLRRPRPARVTHSLRSFADSKSSSPSGGSTTMTLRRRIDADANPADHRDHHFPARSGNHQPAPLHRPVHGGHAPDRLPRRVGDLAADEVVPVDTSRPGAAAISASGIFNSAPTSASAASIVSTPAKPIDAAVPGGTAPTRSSTGSERPGISSCSTRPSTNRSSGKSVSGLTMHVARGSRASARCGRPGISRPSGPGPGGSETAAAATDPGTRARPCVPSSSAAAFDERADRVRPCVPAGRSRVPCRRAPSSARRAIWPRRVRSVTLTASGLSASALAIASTTPVRGSRRGWLAAGAARVGRRRLGGMRSTSVRTVSDGCAPSFSQWASRSRSSFSALRLRARVVVPQHLDEGCCRAPRASR